MGRAARQASISAVSSRGRSGRRRRSGLVRSPIARAVAAGLRAPVRVLAAPALVEHQRQRVDVGLGTGGAALGLLGRHVGEGADDVAGRGQRGAVGEVGDAEVHQLRPRLPFALALGHLHVLRLDVAVDDPARVGMVEGLAEIGADLADLAVGELAGVGEPGQGRALDQLGDEQGVAVLLAHLIEGDDAGMVEPRRGLGLAQHPPSRLAALLDRLDRDRTLEATVPGLVDDAEPAAADAALDQEAVEHERTDQSSFYFASQGLSPAPRGLGKPHRLLPVLTLRPRQASYSSATQPAWRAASWRIRQHARRDAASAHNADPNASRSCCGVGLPLAVA